MATLTQLGSQDSNTALYPTLTPEQLQKLASFGDVVALCSFLTRNGQSYEVLNSNEAEAQDILHQIHFTDDQLPIVICPDGTVLKCPTSTELANILGMNTFKQNYQYDVAIVGANPAGLAAAVYGASDGLSILVLEEHAYRGQAEASAHIENYLGFPAGVSAQLLMSNAFVQAQKFGVDIAIPAQSDRIEVLEHGFKLHLADQRTALAKLVVLATGVAYRRPNVPGLAEYEGRGVYFGASPVEGRLVQDQAVAVVGGGNSAGQAVVYLASKAKQVHLVVRQPLNTSMSQYLIDRIANLPNVTVYVGYDLKELKGDGEQLQATVWQNMDTHQLLEAATKYLFLFIGAIPQTNWLKPTGIRVDIRGFILTGEELELVLESAGMTPIKRIPTYQTSVRNIFAIGDVRSGSVKRVSAAVGEGASVVPLLHGALAT